MWSRAHDALEEMRVQRAALQAQFEEFAKDDRFRRQYPSLMLPKILDAAISDTAADMGDIQLLDPKTGRLFIYVHRGFEQPFLDFFNSVEAGQAACGAALKAARRVIIEDVLDSPVFGDSLTLEIMLDAGVRSVQSTPLVGAMGQTVGVLSTHYRTPHAPTETELRLLDHLADRAAALIEARDVGASGTATGSSDSQSLAQAAFPQP